MAIENEKDAVALFDDISKSLRSGDPSELRGIMDVNDDEQEVTSSEEEEVEEVSPDEDQPTEESAEEDEQEEEEEPSEEAPKEPAEDEDEETAEEDPLSELKAQLEALRKENHSLKSQAGRVPHVQRRLKEIDKKLEELSTRRSSPSESPSAKIKPKVKERLESIRKSDPELADVIESAISDATDGLSEELYSREAESLTLQREQELLEFREEQAQQLLVKHPNAPEVFNSPAWAEWKKEQSPGIRALAESEYASEVSDAFQRYADDMVKKYPDLAPKETPASDNSEQEKARQIEGERQRKKQTAVVSDSPKAAGKVKLPDDPAALFEKYSAQIRKERLG